MVTVKCILCMVICLETVGLLVYIWSLSATISENSTPRHIFSPLHENSSINQSITSEDFKGISHQYKPTSSLSPSVSVSIPRSRNDGLSYVAVLEYADQLGGAMRRFAQLLNITAKWKKHGVDPFVLDSHLGIPRKGKLDGLFHLSDIFNLSSLEVCAGNATASSFEDFLVNSTRELVWLSFVKGKKRDPSIYNCTGDQNAITAFNVYLNSTSVKSKAIAKHGQNYEFKLVKAVCVEAQYSGFLLDDLERAVSVTAGSSSERKHVPTVVIEKWIGLSNSPGIYDFYVKDSLQWSLRNNAVCDVDTLPRTPFVLEAAEEFKKSLSLSGPFIGVHFRIERLMKKDDEKQHGFLDECVEKSGAVIQGMLRKYNLTSKNAIALNDYSDYGSATCTGERSRCVNMTNKIVE